MRFDRSSALWVAFIEFISFAPSRLSLIFALMLLKGLTAGIGLLMLIPLLHLIGVDFGSAASSEFAGIIAQFFSGMGVTLTLPIILLAYIAIISLVAWLSFYLSVLTISVQQAYICQIRHQLYHALLHSKWQFIIRHKMSDFTHGLTSQVQDIGYASYQMLKLISQFILVAVYILLSLLLSWQMTLLAIACGGALLLILLPLHKSILDSGGQELVGYKGIFQMVSEQLASLKMIKSYGSEQHYVGQVDRMSELLEKQEVRMTRISAMTQLVYMVGAAVCFSIFFYFALEWLSVSLASLLMLLLIFSRLLPEISNIQSSYQILLHQLPSFEDMRNMLKACEKAGESKLGNSVEIPQLKDAIVLEQVSYKYEGGNRQIIDNLSLTIKRNSTVALVGPSGAGKSTLADLIAGLLIPDMGKIYCDSTLLEGEKRLAWRRGLAYITQEVFLFHDTVRANLSWVQPEASDEELWAMLELAEAAGFVKRLPKGLDTVIGDRGIRLSGGERQRLALARALLSRPQLLILDEATSALDHKNERKIQQALQHMDGKLTIIIIAHRETSIQHVKQRIELNVKPGMT